MPINRKEKLRDTILGNIAAKVNRETVQTSILADEEALDSLLNTVNMGGVVPTIQPGNDSLGNLYFLVGISTASGGDVVQ